MKTELNFSEDHLSEGVRVYKFASNPFVVSVACIPTREGFETEWVISAPNPRSSSPRFLARLQISLISSKKELRQLCLEIWDNQLADLCLTLRPIGGLDMSPNTLSKAFKEVHAEWHLRGHDLLGSFNQVSETVTERTANMFNLLKSMGYLQAPKMLIEYEAAESLGVVKASTVNRRLHMAREAGLIPLERSRDFTYQDEN